MNYGRILPDISVIFAVSLATIKPKPLYNRVIVHCLLETSSTVFVTDHTFLIIYVYHDVKTKYNLTKFSFAFDLGVDTVAVSFYFHCGLKFQTDTSASCIGNGGMHTNNVRQTKVFHRLPT